MAAVSRFTDPGAYGKMFAAAFNNAATVEVDGPAIQRVNPSESYLGAILHVRAGAAANTPSTQSVAAKLQTSANGTTGWTDIAGSSIAAITTDNGEAQVSVNLSSASSYIRAVVTPSFTGGSSPNIPVIATVFLSGASELPPA